MERIQTIDELVDALGGPNEVGRWLHIGQNAVCNWSLRGSIPPAWHLRLYIETVKRGLSIDPIVFDMTEDEAAPLMKKAKAFQSEGAAA